MTSDKPKQKDGFVLDAVLQGEPRQVWFDESRAKADAVKGLDSMLKQCRPDDLDNAPPPPASDNRGNLPTERPQFGYDFEDQSGKFTVDIRFADGKHPDGPEGGRWNLKNDQIGQDTPHEHDDYARPMPTTLDAGLDPKNFRIGYQAQYRVPDSSAVYSLIAGGDEMGYSTDDRARKDRKGRVNDITGPGD